MHLRSAHTLWYQYSNSTHLSFKRNAYTPNSWTCEQQAITLLRNTVYKSGSITSLKDWFLHLRFYEQHENHAPCWGKYKPTIPRKAQVYESLLSLSLKLTSLDHKIIWIRIWAPFDVQNTWGGHEILLIYHRMLILKSSSKGGDQQRWLYNIITPDQGEIITLDQGDVLH